MTECEHDWGEWERAVEVFERDGVVTERRPTGDLARECQRCGRWEVQWADERRSEGS